jgi:hypothetical protein
LTDLEFIKRTVQLTRSGITTLRERVQSLGVMGLPSVANFVSRVFSDADTASRVAESLCVAQ